MKPKSISLHQRVFGLLALFILMGSVACQGSGPTTPVPSTLTPVTPLVGTMMSSPTALENSRPPLSTRAPVLPTQTLATTPTPSMEGEREAIQKVSQALLLGGGFHYKHSLEECKDAIKEKRSKWCLTLKSIRIIDIQEWNRVFPNAPLFLIELQGYDQYLQRAMIKELIAVQDKRYYLAAEFNKLLRDNKVDITDRNREFVARCFALFSLDRQIIHNIKFTEWNEVDVPTGFWQNYKYRLDAEFLPSESSIYWYFYSKKTVFYKHIGRGLK